MDMPQSALINYSTAAISWLAGSFAGTLAYFQTSETGTAAAWAGVVSALVVGGLMLLRRLLDRYFEDKDKKLQRADEERERELRRDEELHQREIQFWKDHSNIKTLEAFEARLRAHRAVNELNKTHLHVYDCHKRMSIASVEIGEFTFKFGETLMEGIDEEVAKFKASLADRLDEVIHKTSER